MKKYLLVFLIAGVIAQAPLPSNTRSESDHQIHYVLPPNVPYCEACDITDLIYIIDASWTIPEANYQAEIDFIRDITSQSTTYFPEWGNEIGETVQVAVYVFKSFIETKLDFISDNSVTTLQNYLNSIKSVQTGGDSNICTPMNEALQQFKNFGREGAPKTLTIFTDGEVKGSGACTQTIAVQLANTIKFTYGVEILCIAVAGNDGHTSVVNMPFLEQIASKQDINGEPTPLVWSLSDPNALNEAMQSITSRMSCCSCYPDMVHTVEIDNWTANDGQYLQNIFANVNNVASYWLDRSSVPGGTQSLVIMTDNKNSIVAITAATSYNDWINQINAQCPRALSGNPRDMCNWMGSYADITAGLEETKVILSLNIKTFVNSAPDASMMHITGGCLVGTGTSGCSSNSINIATQAYQNAYKLRIGDFLQIGNSSSRSMLQQIVGSDYTIIDGPGTQGISNVNNGDCLTYQIQQLLSNVPGCSAQPYLYSGYQDSCNGLIH